MSSRNCCSHEGPRWRAPRRRLREERSMYSYRGCCGLVIVLCCVRAIRLGDEYPTSSHPIHTCVHIYPTHLDRPPPRAQGPMRRRAVLDGNRVQHHHRRRHRQRRSCSCRRRDRRRRVGQRGEGVPVGLRECLHARLRCLPLFGAVFFGGGGGGGGCICL